MTSGRFCRVANRKNRAGRRGAFGVFRVLIDCSSPRFSLRTIYLLDSGRKDSFMGKADMIKETNVITVDDKMKKRLEQFTGFQVDAEFEYVPKVFREAYPDDKSKWPVFVLRSIDGAQIAEFESRSGSIVYKETGEREVNLSTGKMRLMEVSENLIKVMRYPLKDGALMFYDDNKGEITIRPVGGQAKTQPGKTGRDAFRYFPSSLQIELQRAVEERSILTDEEKLGLEY